MVRDFVKLLKQICVLKTKILKMTRIFEDKTMTRIFEDKTMTRIFEDRHLGGGERKAGNGRGST